MQRSAANARPLVDALQLLWAAAWRLQVAHWAVFVLVPAAAVVANAAFGIALLPFQLLGPGASSTELGTGVAHLASPACWLALAPCSFAEIPLAPLPWAERLADAVEPPMMPWPAALNVRHLWLALWLAWFVTFLVRHERARRETRAKQG